jgi:anaerobic selenocysteine-containing dehydrogenase
MKRVEPGRCERVGWDEAIDGIAAQLRAIHAERGHWATAAYVGNPAAFNALMDVGLAPFLRGLGTGRVHSSGTQDCSSKFAGSECVYGSSTIHLIPDFDHTRHLLVLGSNPGVSHMSFVVAGNPLLAIGGPGRRRAAGAGGGAARPRAVGERRGGAASRVGRRPDTSRSATRRT